MDFGIEWKNARKKNASASRREKAERSCYAALRLRDDRFILDNRSGDLSTLQDETVSQLARLMDVPARGYTRVDPSEVEKPAAYQEYLKDVKYCITDINSTCEPAQIGVTSYSIKVG
jgi:hypothetical protein